MATLVPQFFTPEALLSAADVSAASVRSARVAQAAFAASSLPARLEILKRTRHKIAAHCRELASAVVGVEAIGMQRSLADVLVAEVLPLAEAIRFLEREAASILRPVKLGRSGRPFWLRGVRSEVERVPLGVVLVIAPSNYPLFLAGVQCVQALAAGNSVLWKPAPGGASAARAFARLLTQAGLPDGVLQILDESHQSGIEAIHAGVDKVFLTGHADTGRVVMHELSETRTPSVMELSGCDPVFILEGADLERVASALAFGMRLNGSATCMAPRRVFATHAITRELMGRLLPKLAAIERVPLAPHARALLDDLLLDVQKRGGTIKREGRLAGSTRVSPTVVVNAPHDADILRTDIFAPLLTFCVIEDENAALAANAECPYALTASVFGPELQAAQFTPKLNVGTVLMNDLIVSTADPRISFGGRGASGFGTTRGREGLLEMTAVKTVIKQGSRSLRAYAATTAKHEPFFASYIEAAHAGSFRARFRGLRNLFIAARDVENDGK
jgi:acyl-CoA reductase-like NAD-dependent aldehyde dehydrogenase